MSTILTWFAKNGVAANLLMLLVIFGGVMGLREVRTEVFPEFSADLVSVEVEYLGAAPEEVEEAVCARIEERVQDLTSIKRLRSVATEGRGVVTIELLPGVDAREALDDVKARVDAIDTFPEETEKPVIQEIVLRRHVLSIALYGPAGEHTLKRLAEDLRDEILATDAVTQVDVVAARPYEVSIEVSEDRLRRHGLTFDRVATAVRSSSLDLPGGSVKTERGEILLRTEGQAYRGREFEDLVLLTRGDGTRLTLGQVATVVDGFAETDQAARYNGQPAVIVRVFRVGDQDVNEVVALAKETVEQARAWLPAGIGVDYFQDETVTLRERLDTLLDNGRLGLVLVLLVLALFLRLRLAPWVAMGIVISFMGALWLMPVLDLSINLISLFAFIVVLGIVVDDAIVVGENIFRHHQMGKVGLEAAVDGVKEVAVPVVFSVLTTIAAFAPLTMVTGNTGKIMKVIPLVVIATLVFSLLESLLVLPSHLSHLYPRPAGGSGVGAAIRRFQRWTSGSLEWLRARIYRPALEWALEWRYQTVATGVAIMLLTVGFVASGVLKFSFLPQVEGNNVVAFLTLPQGTPAEVTAEALARLEASAREVERQVARTEGKDIYSNVLTSVGEQPFRSRQSRTSFIAVPAAAHLGEVSLELVPAQQRTITAGEVTRRWRELAGTIPDAVELTFTATLFSTGEPINIQLAGPRTDELAAAAEELGTALGRYPGVYDVTDSFRAGKEEVKLAVTPHGEALGISLAGLAHQVRQAFYGEEVQRIQRGRDELKVMVRYPEAERRTLSSLEAMRVRTPEGEEVPFSLAARAELGRGFASIERTDRKRTLNVTADVDLAKSNSNEILADVRARVLPDLLSRYRGLSYSLEGEQQQQRETIAGLRQGFILAIFIIYMLLAVPFRSYVQPIIVMGAIPFGLIGAVWGHVIMGYPLTVMSLFGLVALTGVVVNDSLVLVDFINRTRRRTQTLHDAVVEAGETRFRPILLTSLTTFAGLSPLLFERSLQAQFLIPMAISLAFGVLFATGIILILVPVGYYILEDVRRLAHRAWHGRAEIETAHP